VDHLVCAERWANLGASVMAKATDPAGKPTRGLAGLFSSFVGFFFSQSSWGRLFAQVVAACG